MDPSQREHRQPRALGGAAVDLIALLRVLDVLEDEREPALALVVDGEVALGQRPADPVAKLAVEGHLAQVDAEAGAGAAARLVGRGELDDHGLALAAFARVGDAEAVAHLAGADRRDPAKLEPVAAEHPAEPFAADLVGGPDQRVRHQPNLLGRGELPLLLAGGSHESEQGGHDEGGLVIYSPYVFETISRWISLVPP